MLTFLCGEQAAMPSHRPLRVVGVTTMQSGGLRQSAARPQGHRCALILAPVLGNTWKSGHEMPWNKSLNGTARLPVRVFLVRVVGVFVFVFFSSPRKFCNPTTETLFKWQGFLEAYWHQDYTSHEAARTARLVFGSRGQAGVLARVGELCGRARARGRFWRAREDGGGRGCRTGARSCRGHQVGEHSPLALFAGLGLQAGMPQTGKTRKVSAREIQGRAEVGVPSGAPGLTREREAGASRHGRRGAWCPRRHLASGKCPQCRRGPCYLRLSEEMKHRNGENSCSPAQSCGEGEVRDFPARVLKICLER